jgi:hypothetical protein
MKKKLLTYLPLVICSGLAAFFCYFPITDTDIFWHLAAGREIINHRHFLSTDPFAFSLASPQWIDLHWFFQIVVYGLYVLGGLKAILAFKLAIVVCVVSVLCLVFPSRRYITTAALSAALLFYGARYLVLDRPVLITLLCMAVYIFLFEQTLRGRKKRWLWWCVPLQIIWTNSQGLYPIGIFIIGAYWVEYVTMKYLFPRSPFSCKEREENSPSFRMFTLLLFCCCLSCCVTPYGIAGLLLPMKLFSRISPYLQHLYSFNISENVPLFALTGFEAGYRAWVIFSALASCVLFALNRKNPRIAHMLLFLGFLFLAISAVRNVLLFFILLIPVIGYNAMSLDLPKLFGAFQPVLKKRVAAAMVAAALLVLALCTVKQSLVVATYPPGRLLSPFRFPEKIVGYLKENPLPGNMFNDIRYGGFLLWSLYPQKKVLIDGRLVIRSPQFFAEYLAICEQPELFDFAAKKFNITHAILPSAIFTQYRRLIKWLYYKPGWRLEYTDGSSFLLVADSVSQRQAINLADLNAVRAIADSIRFQWHNAPYVRNEALGYFTDMLEYLGLTGSAEAVKEEN